MEKIIKPGDKLHTHLKKFGVDPSNSCECVTWIDTLNSWGVDLSLQKIPKIVHWIQLEAILRGLPFNRANAEKLVTDTLLALKNSQENTKKTD